MFSTRNIISSLVFLAALSSVSCLPLVDLTDANQAILNLELSKDLKSVQDAYENDFKFSHVFEVDEFLLHCQHLQEAMRDAKDSDYQGLAATIKALLAEKSIVEACKVDRGMLLREYGSMDENYSVRNLDYLSEKRFMDLVKYHKKSDEGLVILLGHLISRRIQEFSDALLEQGAKDTAILFGEQQPNGFLDLETRYKSGCEISSLKPICKFARGTHFDTDATGSELMQIASGITGGDRQAIIEGRSKSSEVSFEEVVETCGRVLESQYLKVPHLLKAYMEAGLLDETKVEQRFYTDKDLHLYYGIYNFCSQLK